MAWDTTKVNLDRAHPMDATEYNAMVARIKAHKNEHITGGTDAIPVATTTKTGLSPILPNDANVFYNGVGGFTAPPGSGTVTEVTGTAPIQVATGTVTPVVSIVAASAIVPGSMSAADFSKLAAIEALADVTDATNVNAAGAVMETDYNAQTVLIATADNTPLPVTITASSFVGRKASGDAGILTAAEAKAVLAIAESDVTSLTTDLAAKIAKTTNITALNETGIADGEIAVFNLSAKDIRTSNVTIATTLGTDDTTVPTSKAVKDVTDVLVTKASYDAYTVLAADTDNTPAALTVGASTIVGRKASGGIVALSKAEAQTVLNVADGANAYVHPNHSGEVTSAADGAQTIAAAAVTLAKMANLAQDKIIGRATASTGVPEAITCTAAGRALLDDAAASDQRTTLGLGTIATAAATDYVAAADYNAQSTVIAVSDNTPTALTIGEQTLLGRITGGDVTALTPTQVRIMLNVAEGAGAGTVTAVTATAPLTSTEGTTPLIAISAASAGAAGSMSAAHYSKLEAIEAAADVTDATNVNAAGAVMEADYGAYTILAADTDDTPVALTLAASTLPARLATGGIVAATAAQVSAMLPQRTRPLNLTASNAIQPNSDSATMIQTALATNSFPLPRGQFTTAGRTTEWLAWFTPIEDNWDLGTMTAQAVFNVTDVSSASVSWLLFCIGVDDGESLTQLPTLVATLSKALGSTDAYSLRKTAVSSAFAIPGTGTGRELLWILKRADTDTYTGTPEFLAIKCLYGVT